MNCCFVLGSPRLLIGRKGREGCAASPAARHRRTNVGRTGVPCSGPRLRVARRLLPCRWRYVRWIGACAACRKAQRWTGRDRSSLCVTSDRSALTRPGDHAGGSCLQRVVSANSIIGATRIGGILERRTSANVHVRIVALGLDSVRHLRHAGASGETRICDRIIRHWRSGGGHGWLHGRWRWSSRRGRVAVAQQAQEVAMCQPPFGCTASFGSGVIWDQIRNQCLPANSTLPRSMRYSRMGAGCFRSTGVIPGRPVIN